MDASLEVPDCGYQGVEDKSGPNMTNRKQRDRNPRADWMLGIPG